MRALGNYEHVVKAIAENGGSAEGLSGAAAETFANAHPNAQARMLEGAEGSDEVRAGGRQASGRSRQGAREGLIYGAVDWAATEAFWKLTGWTREDTEKRVDDIKAKGAEWREQHGLTLVGRAKGAEVDAPVRPKAAASQIDDAATKATAAGEALKAALDITLTPKIDFSAFDALETRIAKLSRSLERLGALERTGGGERADSIRRGYKPSTGALHDGPEAR